MTELYVKDIKVWIPDPVNVWQSARILEDYTTGDKSLKLVTDDGVTKDLSIVNPDKDLPHLRNPSILIGQNDLTALSYLHEPDVLHNLEVRFLGKQTIYTYCGIILVAINPYQDLPLYGLDIIRAYRGHNMGELEPHIFAIAEEAFAKLEREKSDISIIVSGESGAGKTMSAKYAMRYFAAVGGNESQTHIERKVLASSPVMESFGNAKTTRNNNSSRFGKFTQLLFTNEMSVMSLTGATMKTYLLEKSRVVFQAAGERNYHIFYQLCAAKDNWNELLLDDWDKFNFLNQGNATQIPSDASDFQETISSLKTCGFSADSIKDIMHILAGILHLGNIRFVSNSNRNNSGGEHEDSCNIAVNDLHLSVLCDLLQINKKDLRKWLITRQIDSYNEQVLIPHNKHAAETARDALAKHIYAKLFDYIVQVINQNLVSDEKQDAFIGVLDIYGFETFETNSFEQFCINYANEKLQQQFNQHVFKLEQEEYLKEGIVWTMIDFYDNQPCINLIEEKLGVLDLLDEECRMMNGTDETWLTKLYEKCVKYDHFAKPRFGTQAFLIKHFSDTVQYESRGFVEKNRDHISKELVGVLQMSDMAFCRQLMTLDASDGKKMDGPVSPAGQEKVVIRAKYATLSKQPQKKTVGSQFRESLASLIGTLSKTTSHYVRCIKPNEEKAPFKWEPQKIVQQLRACGVLETVRISAAGFPSRWSYDRFYERYHLLCTHKERNSLLDWNIQTISTKLVEKWIKDPEKYRFGKTQIFFRAGQVAYLEQVRSDLRKRSIIIVQAHIRRFIYERKYKRVRATALGLQRYGRGYIARQKAKEIRQTRAAITIQRYFRGWKCRNAFRSMRKTILGIQTRARGMLVRRKFKVLLDNYKAIQIQRFCRGYLARRAFKQRKHSIIVVQSLVRRFLARRMLKKLKAEARSITHIQKLYKGLEQKIFELQQRNDVLTKENQGLKIQAGEVPELKSRLEIMRNLENELKSIKTVLSEKEDTIQTIQSALDKEQDEKMDILQEKNKLEEMLQHEKEVWTSEKADLCEKLEILTTNREDSPSTKRSKIMLNVDNNEIHNAYQKSVKDKENLENENNALKVEVKRLQYILTHPNELEVFSKSHSNTSNDDSLESKRSSNLSDNQLYENHRDKVAHKDATSIILRLRKLLEEEKTKGERLRKEVGRFRDKTNFKITVADIIRLSELEVENEKLKQDYQLLRNSIDRGVAGLELEAQYQTIVNELARSREECVQLKAILAQQSESLRSLTQQTTVRGGDSERVYDENELVEAFQAQKLVNKQLELELKALTEEQNAKLVELHKQIDDLTTEKTRLHGILHEQLDKVTTDENDNEIEEILRQNNYLRCEVERSAGNYIEMQEQMNDLQARVNDLLKQNKLLLNVIKENGLNDPTVSNKSESDQNNLLAVKKKAQNYQGIFKYRPEDEPKILQRLVHDLSPRIALTLPPGLPAFIIFMCIRYTDLVNADQHVRTLLSQFVLSIKKIYKVIHPVDNRILWIVNAITLLNLLKQYGGVDDYLAFNTTIQNEQQLKNFDLSEYRTVIYETILVSYAVVMRQIQTIIKPFIVPAILDHDEMSRGQNRSRTKSLESMNAATSPTEPKSLIKNLDGVYQKLKYFGLDPCYIEQFITQLMKYICAVAMNNLMLRPEICMWKTGMRIRYNVSCLEGWIRETQLSKDVLNPLQPLNEVAQVLQARKLEEEDIESLCELCPHLTAGQVLKIIKSYTSDDCENAIKPAFIEKLAKKLKERPGNLADDSFSSDENAIIGLAVVYKQSEIKLEEIEIPSCLQLDGLLMKI